MNSPRVPATARPCLGRRQSLLATVAFAFAALATAALYGQTIRIENASPNRFHYSVRRQSAGWSGRSLELGPGQQHTYREPAALVVSYWTDQARFATLQPGNTYRIDDTRGGQLRAVEATSKPHDEPPSVAKSNSHGHPGGPDGGAAGPRLRVVKILAVADWTYRRIVDDWERRIRDTVRNVSTFYTSNFGIRFVVTDVQALDYKGLHDKPDDRWKRLLSLSPEDADVLVAFVGFGDYYRDEDQEDKAVYIGHLGQGMPFGQHVMVSGEKFIHPNRDRAVLIHEMAHLFGAFHVQSEQSVMQRGYRDIPIQDIIQGDLYLDPPLREVITLARNVDFRRGVASLSPETRERIQALCRRYRHPAESKSPDTIELGYRYLRRRAEAIQQSAVAPESESLPQQNGKEDETQSQLPG